ncbi:MAG: hypothetical protein WAP03_01180 [Methylorubrum rhodinum]|uniref:hypothetical protein n=1 Tax=Methylorubrum rhodinum TaxID=29428 RepID=UPI003BAE50D4
MLPLPAHFAELILAFAPLFVQRSWRHAHLLLVGAILTPGRRTVTSVLRIMGRAQERLRIPTEAGHPFRGEAGQRSDLMSATIPR